MTSKEIARQIARAVPYLKHGGGGVTVSGGDPMLQPEFVGAIFQECRRMGVPTAIDTTGMVGVSCPLCDPHSLALSISSVSSHQSLLASSQGSKGLWRKLLPYTDMVMLCVKAPKPDMYRKITGGFNQDAMLRFAAVTHMMGIPLWLRYVLLPDKTDSDYDVEWLAQFCKDHRWGLLFRPVYL